MASTTPNVVHFIFGMRPKPDAFHLAHYLCIASCLEVNRPDEILLHVHHEPTGPWWKRIRDRVTLVRVTPDTPASGFAYPDRFSARFRYAHHSDFLRLQILLEHGGVYADIDTLFTAPLSEEVLSAPFAIGREADVDQRTGEPQPSLCNALLAAPAGAEFAGIWLDRMEAAYDGSWSAHSTLLPQKLATERPELVSVQPPEVFYPFMWTREDLHALFEEEHALPDQATSIHLWAHLWWSRRRRDFSAFHAGRLNERYVRRAATTYAALAAQFLPRAAGPGATGQARAGSQGNKSTSVFGSPH